MPGLSVEVLEFADRLLLRNHTGKTVTIYGYSGEPYARLLPNGVGRTEQALAGRLPQHQLLRQRHGPPSANAARADGWEASIAQGSSNGTTTASTG